jgi:hypothetical protein
MQAINAQRLVEAIPTWLDQSVAQKEANDIRKFAAEVYGYTAQDIDGIVDYRHIVALRDAAKFHALQNKAKDTKAAIQTAPKLAQPGATRPGNPQALEKHRITQKAVTAPSRDNLAALLSKL